MEPFSLAVSVVGLGMSLFGGISAADDAKKAAKLQGDVGVLQNSAAGTQSNIAGLQGDIEDQRHKAMELSAHRQQTEILRNNQRARAMAMSNATSQGAQFGTGLQGGLAQVEDQGLFNLAGVSQNLEIGQAQFGINKEITAQKQQLALTQGQIAQTQGQVAQAQGQMTTDQSIASLGGALVKSGPTIGAIGSSIYSGFGSTFGGYPGTYTSQKIPT